MKADVVVVAAGKGRRLHSQIPKQFVLLAGKPILAHTLTIFDQHPRVADIIIVGAAGWLLHISSDIVEKFNFRKVNRIIPGGEERKDSVIAGIAALKSDRRPVLIHDGVRPFVTAKLIERLLNGLEGADACIPVLPCVDTIKEIDGEWVKRTIHRERMRRVQTPQAFHLARLREALQFAEQEPGPVTDEATLIERAHGNVRCVDGELENIKITTDFDLKVANLILCEKNACG